MTDWKAAAHRYLRLLRCELAISKRISNAGIRVTADLQAERRKNEKLRVALTEEMARRVEAEFGAVSEEEVRS